MPEQASSRCANHSLGIVCTFCGASFGRQEHLTRHVRSHLNHRPFQCQSCDRRFSRSDALSRHVTTNCPANRRKPARASAPRASAACLSCARSKQRCPGGSPCQRCMSKGGDCVYSRRSTERRAKKRSQWESLNQTVSADATPLPEVPGVPAPPSWNDVSFPEPSAGVDQPLQKQPGDTCLAVNDELHMADMGRDWGNFSDLDWLLPFEFGNLGDNAFHDTVSPEELDLTQGLPSFTGAHKTSIPQVHRERPIDESMYGMIQPSLWTSYPLAASPSQKPTSSLDKTGKSFLDNRGSYTAKDKHGCGRPSLSDILQMDDFGHVPKITATKVAELHDYIVRCNDSTAVERGVDLAPLRNQAVMNMFIQSYFEHFHASLPLLHRVTFNPCEAPLILNLAVVTIGSHYSRAPKAYKYTKLLGDCLRMSISRLCDREIDQSIEIPFAQSVILSQIDTAYSGEREYVLKAQFQRSYVVTICRGTAAGLQQRSRADAATKDRKILYQRWLRRELELRIVYCGWLLDCQYSLHYDIPFIMTLDEIDLRIPCDEKTWDSAVDDLNVEELMLSKSISPKDILASGDLSQSSIGDLTRVICIACIYHQSRLMLQTCNAWFVSSQGTATYGGAFDNPIYTNWRQWAVDKLTSLTQSSLRQPNHQLSITTDKLYHVVSILLYLPFKRLCASVGWLATEASKQSAQEETSSWLGQNNGIHARTAVRHAAVLFALFRTDSVRMYHGASSFLLATLTIWAYATLQPCHDCSNYAADSTDIYLDRKMSSSEEEAWISGTVSLVPRIAGVGCIQGSQGARRLLLEACQILRSWESWGISRHLQLVFERLIVSGDALAL